MGPESEGFRPEAAQPAPAIQPRVESTTFSTPDNTSWMSVSATTPEVAPLAATTQPEVTLAQAPDRTTSGQSAAETVTSTPATEQITAAATAEQNRQTVETQANEVTGKVNELVGKLDEAISRLKKLEEEQETASFKVVDRRRITADGEIRTPQVTPEQQYAVAEKEHDQAVSEIREAKQAQIEAQNRLAEAAAETMAVIDAKIAVNEELQQTEAKLEESTAAFANPETTNFSLTELVNLRQEAARLKKEKAALEDQARRAFQALVGTQRKLQELGALNANQNPTEAASQATTAESLDKTVQLPPETAATPLLSEFDMSGFNAPEAAPEAEYHPNVDEIYDATYAKLVNSEHGSVLYRPVAARRTRWQKFWDVTKARFKGIEAWRQAKEDARPEHEERAALGERINQYADVVNRIKFEQAYQQSLSDAEDQIHEELGRTTDPDRKAFLEQRQRELDTAYNESFARMRQYEQYLPAGVKSEQVDELSQSLEQDRAAFEALGQERPSFMSRMQEKAGKLLEKAGMGPEAAGWRGKIGRLFGEQQRQANEQQDQQEQQRTQLAIQQARQRQVAAKGLRGKSTNFKIAFAAGSLALGVGMFLGSREIQARAAELAPEKTPDQAAKADQSAELAPDLENEIRSIAKQEMREIKGMEKVDVDALVNDLRIDQVQSLMRHLAYADLQPDRDQRIHHLVNIAIKMTRMNQLRKEGKPVTMDQSASLEGLPSEYYQAVNDMAIDSIINGDTGLISQAIAIYNNHNLEVESHIKKIADAKLTPEQVKKQVDQTVRIAQTSKNTPYGYGSGGSGVVTPVAARPQDAPVPPAPLTPNTQTRQNGSGSVLAAPQPVAEAGPSVLAAN